MLALSLVAATAEPPQQAQAEDLTQVAAGFKKLFMHDECTGQYPPQPDTCLHERLQEKSFVFGGKAGAVYDVALRIRGIFEPTVIKGGETPDPEHPYFRVGGIVDAPDWSHWHIEVSNPRQTYWLNHYPKVSHTIYKEDFEATIAVAAGATVVVRVIDGNDRQIDNGKPGPDRQQVITGAVDDPRPGQMLRLDVLRVKARAHMRFIHAVLSVVALATVVSVPRSRSRLPASPRSRAFAPPASTASGSRLPSGLPGTSRNPAAERSYPRPR